MPHLSRNRSALALVAVVALSGCKDVVAPVTSRVEALVATISNLVTCDNSWTQPVDGLWSEASKWSAGTVPTSTQDVCITVEGSYTVIARDFTAAKSITIGGPARAVQPSLWVEGTKFFSTGFAMPADLIVVEDVENYGTLRLTSAGNNGARALLDVGGTLRNFAGARFESVVGATAERVFRGSLVNDGTVDIQWFTAFDRPNATYANNGAFAVGDGSTWLEIVNGGAFTQAGGSLALTGRFIQRSGSFTWAGGAISGGNTPELHNVGLTIPAGSTGTGAVRVRESPTLSGNVYAGQTLIIEGHRPTTTGTIFPTTLTSATGFSNAGTITLTANGTAGTDATLTVTNGQVQNSGRIETLPADGGSRFIRATIVNDGVMDLQAGAEMPGSYGITNRGSLSVANARALTLGVRFSTATPAYHQLAGSTTLAQYGRLIQWGGSFTLGGGAIAFGEESPELHNVALTIPPGSAATGALRLREFSSLTGDIAAGQQIDIDAWRPGSTGSSFPATLTTNGAVTNRGTVRITGGDTHATLDARNGGFTNAAGARLEVTSASNGGRFVVGSVTNEGVITNTHWGLNFNQGILRNRAPGWINGPATLIVLDQGLTFFGDGVIDAYVVNHGVFNVGHSPGLLDLRRDFNQSNTGRLNIELGGSPSNPGVDFDRVRIGEGMYMQGTLSVSAANGACVDGGQTFVIMTSRNVGNSDFHTFVNGIAGRTITPEKSTTDYKLHVSGPACVPPDVTPPVIAPTVTGTLGDNGWYTSDVSVTWSVTDAESAVSSKTGCDATSLTTDNAGTTYTCSATSAGGTNSQSVTVKRDATAPVITTSSSPAPNANGWNNTDVRAFWSGSDAMSGLVGTADRTSLFNGEGIAMNFGGRYTDNAGNTATALVYASIDRTPPVTTVTRSPAPGPDGWNETDVTVTYSAIDPLSGIDGSASATQVFGLGENQSGSRVFADRAGNTATASISGINVGTPAPPPPPPTLSCSATPNSIWPPNNKMVAIKVTITGGSPILRSVTNNETGTADVEGWTIGTADLAGSVRATRKGGGTGRVYTLAYDVTHAGGTSPCLVKITVPHDQGGK